MNYIERVPCSDQVHHTAFMVNVNEPEKGVLVVNFMPADNFKLADTSWRQRFTEDVTTQLHEAHPDKGVVFQIN